MVYHIQNQNGLPLLAMFFNLCTFTQNWLFVTARSQGQMFSTGNSIWKGRLSTVDLLVLTSLYQLIFILKKFITFVAKQVALMRRSMVWSLPLRLEFPGYRQNFTIFCHFWIIVFRKESKNAKSQKCNVTKTQNRKT